MTAKQWLLLCLAIAGLLKGVWGVIWPTSMKSVTRWWMRATQQVNTLLAIVVFAGAIAIWGFVLMNQDAVSMALLIYGLLLAWVGTMYLHKDQLTKMVSRLILDRESSFIRVLSLIVTSVCAVLIWIAVR